jgi:hypothetical protein
MNYLRQAIAPSTREAYAVGVAAFRQWRTTRGTLPDGLPTANEIGCWLADAADRGRQTASTLRTYLAGIGAWHRENRHPDSREPNPAADDGVRGILKGIQREEARRQQARPLAAAGGQPSDLPLPTLTRFRFNDTERDRLFQAAAFLAVGGGLRPGELLGSATEPDRALRREQIAFYSDAAGLARQPLPNAGDQADALPQVLQLTLRKTKTSQLRPVQKMIAAPSVIAAVWRWMCATAERGPRELLFQLPGKPPMSTQALVKDMERRHVRAGLGPVTYTGKSWRQGGAGTLAALGYDEGDIAALGWAPDSKMWERYAHNPQVRRQRAIMRARLMEPERLRDPPAAADRR